MNAYFNYTLQVKVYLGMLTSAKKNQVSFLYKCESLRGIKYHENAS